MRLTLSVASPTPSGTELYRLAVGLLDEEEVPTLASAITEIANLARASPAAAGAETIDMSFRGGSVRIGLLRFQGETVAYLQAGDLQALALRPVWEVPSTMYMPSDELPALASVIDRLAAKVKQLRGL